MKRFHAPVLILAALAVMLPVELAADLQTEQEVTVPSAFTLSELAATPAICLECAVSMDVRESAQPAVSVAVETGAYSALGQRGYEVLLEFGRMLEPLDTPKTNEPPNRTGPRLRLGV